MKNSLISMLLLISVSILGQVTKNIQVSTAGTLSTLLTATEKSTITNLTITGTINAVDFQTMRDAMPAIKILDLSGVTISAYNEMFYSFPANEIPYEAFALGSEFINGKLVTHYYSSLTMILLPKSGVSIGQNAFNGCIGLKSIEIPEGYQSIVDGAFWNCTALESITIPSTVTSIGTNGVWYNCKALQSIYVNNPTPVDISWGNDDFYNVSTTACTLYVPTGSKAAYMAAGQWKNFVNIVESSGGGSTEYNTVSFQCSGVATLIDSVEITNLTKNTRLLLKNGNALKLTDKPDDATQNQMNYVGGDRLLFKAYSGKLSTIVTDIPTGNKTINFEFVECKDADGNYYTTVKIGNQLWMAENLRTTKYRNGDAIPLLQSDVEWTSSTDGKGKCCRYYQTGIVGGESIVIDGYNEHGLLYDVKTVYDTRNIAPEGWHVSIQEDWNTLIDFLGGGSVAGTKLKDSGVNYWNSNYKTNESGFTGRAGGARRDDGSFTNINGYGYWWVKTDRYGAMMLTYDSPYIYGINPMFNALSLRCVKDPTSAKYIVSATAFPTEGGAVLGGGSYAIADINALVATPNYGYKFSNWTENGVVVSNLSSYSYIVAGNRALVANFIPDITTNSSVQPQISINPGVVDLGAKVTITGKNFTPNKSVHLSIVSIDGGIAETITADNIGGFKFIYTAPSVVSSSNGVDVEVIARDNNSGIIAPSKVFSIVVPKTPIKASINIVNIENTYKINQPITISWTEMLYKSAGGVNYPFDAKTGMRSYSYNVEYKTSDNGVWNFIKKIEGSALFDNVLMKNLQFNIDQPYQNCQIRITDNYNNQSVALSNIFAVEPSILGTALEWDYSFPNRNGWPRGVAADGVARVYLKVKLDKIDKKPTVTVKLSAEGVSESSIDLLGKVMKATVTDKYHNEANEANSITASSSIVDSEGYVWFWYVAPENFTSGGTNSPLAYASERTVNAVISVSYEGGSTLPDVIQSIKIVRPPLMMVHGLNGSHDSFIGFHYSKDNIKYYFSSLAESNPTNLFIVNNSVDLIPNASFNVNASLLLTPDCVGCGVNANSTNYKNSFQGNIETIRLSGFASNQVDYVCHSMGGCVLRTAIDKYSNLFYGKEGGANSVYKTYEKGFVNKTITINTPHNGSPIADLFTEHGSLLSGLFLVDNLQNNPFTSSFMVADNGNILWYKATDAVVNLQVSGEGSVALKETTVKNHLIAGDMNFIPSALDVKSGFYKSMIDFIDIFWKALSLTNPEIIQFAKYDKIERTNRFVEWYCKSKKFASPWSHGDFVVSLASQLAMSEIVGAYPSNISVFNGISTFHLTVVDQTEVGNRVLELLNSDVNGTYFANSIPANSVHKANVSSQAPKKIKQEVRDTTYINTKKIEIVSPVKSSIVYADSTVSITYNLKDTTKLAYTTYSFQGDFDVSVSKANVQQLNLQINAGYLGKQTIVVSAVYVFPDSAVTYIDTLSVDVQTKAQLIDFQASPSIMYIYKGVKYKPTLKATYSNGIINVPFNSPDLTVEIDNPKIVKYNKMFNNFEGLDTLTTFAKITYKGISDTIYFSVMDTISQINTEGPSGFVENYLSSSKLLNAYAYPNPFNNSFILEFTLPESGETKLEIFNIFGVKVKELDLGFQMVGLYKKSIDLKNLYSGIYLFKLSSGKFSQKGNLLKIQNRL